MFRHTVYVVPTSRQHQYQGREKVTTVDDDTVILDRYGSMETMIFPNSEAFAKSRLSMAISVGLYTSHHINISHVFLPASIGAMSKISSRFTFKQLLDVNNDIRDKTIYSMDQAKFQLLRDLKFLEVSNLITFWRIGPPTVAAKTPLLLSLDDNTSKPVVVGSKENMNPIQGKEGKGHNNINFDATTDPHGRQFGTAFAESVQKRYDVSERHAY